MTAPGSSAGAAWVGERASSCRIVSVLSCRALRLSGFLLLVISAAVRLLARRHDSARPEHRKASNRPSSYGGDLKAPSARPSPARRGGHPAAGGRGGGPPCGGGGAA